jgi:hypothetical protein
VGARSQAYAGVSGRTLHLNGGRRVSTFAGFAEIFLARSKAMLRTIDERKLEAI